LQKQAILKRERERLKKSSQEFNPFLGGFSNKKSKGKVFNPITGEFS